MSTEPKTLFADADLDGLLRYAEAALGWEFIDEDGDLYYQRMFNLAGDVKKLVAALRESRERLGRAAYVAEHLMQMIDRETWRATGGDDGQGHYEGDYREEQTYAEIQTWKKAAGA